MARKKKAKQASEDKKAPEVEVEDSEPEVAREAEDEWQVVHDVRADKYKQRKLRKQQEAAPAASTESGPVVEEKKGSRASAKDKDDDDGWAQVSSKSKKQQAPKTKKVTKAAKQSVKPQGADAVIDLIKKILENAPTQYLQLSTVGDRFQAQTNTSWNKTYKPQYGLLKTFIESKPDVFVVDEKLDRVYLVEQFQAVQEQKQAEHQRLEDARQRKKEKRARQQQAQEEAGQAVASEGTNPNPLMSVAVVVGLLAGAAALTMYLVNSGSSR